MTNRNWSPSLPRSLKIAETMEKVCRSSTKRIVMPNTSFFRVLPTVIASSVRPSHRRSAFAHSAAARIQSQIGWFRSGVLGLITCSELIKGFEGVSEIRDSSRRLL